MSSSEMTGHIITVSQPFLGFVGKRRKTNQGNGHPIVFRGTPETWADGNKARRSPVYKRLKADGRVPVTRRISMSVLSALIPEGLGGS